MEILISKETQHPSQLYGWLMDNKLAYQALSVIFDGIACLTSVVISGYNCGVFICVQTVKTSPAQDKYMLLIIINRVIAQSHHH